MMIRPVLTIALTSIVIASCGGGGSDDSAATLPEVTLLTTTSEAPLFQEGDGELDDPTTEVASTDVTDEAASTTVAAAVTTTVPAPASAESTTTVVAATAPTETSPPPIGGGFVLGADGLGAIPFGADPEQTITFLNSVFGAPTSDTGWVDPFDIGPCGGTRLRQVNWTQLQLEFGDVSGVTEGRDHFYAYFYGAEGSSTPQPAGLKTAEGVGAGSSVAELLAAYPGTKLLQGDDFIGPSFNVNDNLTGRVSGTADDDVVEAIIGGRPCDG